MKKIWLVPITILNMYALVLWYASKMGDFAISGSDRFTYNINDPHSIEKAIFDAQIYSINKVSNAAGSITMQFLILISINLSIIYFLILKSKN